jgi:tetratricopeptide (TPR) repeat protein
VARGAAKQRTARPRPAPQKRGSGGGRGAYSAAEQAMFFPRLRRQAKWVFVFLALVFALGFVFFGVGSGSSGITDVLSNFGSLFGGNKTKVSSGVQKAQKQVDRHPDRPHAWLKLADALTNDGRTNRAITALEHYVKLRPKDADVQLRIGTFYLQRGSTQSDKALAAQQGAPASLATVTGGSASQLTQSLEQDPISQLYQQRATTAFQKAATDYQKAESAYDAAAKLRPDDAPTQLQLARLANYLRDSKVALRAYRQFLKIAPDDPQASEARSAIATLRQSVRSGRG